MNTLIQQALDDDDVLRAALLVAQKLEPGMSLQPYLSMIKEWTVSFSAQIDRRLDKQQLIQEINRLFYTDLAFAGQPKSLLASDYALMDQVMLYRNGCAVCLCILYCHLARSMGVDARGVGVPGHYLVRVSISDDKCLFLDSLTGKILRWSELETLYLQIAGEMPEYSMVAETFAPASNRDTLIRLLQNLKGAFINQEDYQHALTASDLLVMLSPDDPYERRGRGWLLQQLNCYNGAYADYQYYIRHCPQDPAAHLLKMQLRNHSLQSQTLH